jgi:peroxiredoxin
MTEQKFEDKLAQIRATYCEELPTPELAVLTKTIARLRRLGITASCLQVGETVPDFEFIDASDSPKSLYSVLDKGPVVINFFRGYWCRYCKTEIEAYENIQPELDAMGCTYFAVSPQKPDTAVTELPNYQVIFDRDNKIARQFGVVYSLEGPEIELFTKWGLKINEVNDSSRWELPVPATFVICADRTVGYEYVDVDFRARCCPDQLVEELKGFCRCG